MGKGFPLAGVGRSSTLGPLAVRVRDEQVAMLYGRNRVPTLLGIPFGFLICAFAWEEARHEWLLAWLALKVITAGGRLVLDALHSRYGERSSAEVWGDRYVAALGIDGLAWSLLIILFAQPGASELAPVVIAAIIGVGSSGLVALSTDRRANTVFAAALLAPGAARLLLLGTRLGLFGGFAMALFLGIIIEHGVRVSAATSELLRLRFEVTQARDFAVAAARAKGEFLATMSHELRTPLNAVIGMAALLADTEMSHDQRDRLDVIRASAETLLTLIGDILDVSKIEAGKLEVESAPVDIARVVEEALDQVAPAAFAKGLEIGYEIDEGCPASIVSDPTRVRQILANLLGNAIKFTAEGSVTVNVAAVGVVGIVGRAAADATQPARAPGPIEVTFAVHDTGIGIDPAALSRLFVPFTQADATTTRRYGGSGLGLAICKSLSELLGGTIGAESSLGAGSTFHFSIVGEPLDHTRIRALPINAGSRVCVASDNVTARALLARHVTDLNLVATPVASVAAALEIMAAKETDLVVLDARGTHEEAVRDVRALRGSADAVPAVVLLSPREVSQFRASGPQDPLIATTTKPAKTGRLLELIEALLAGLPAPARQSSMSDIAAAARPPGAALGSALVVDDNAVNRRVALEMVKRLGLTVRAVQSGSEAIEAVHGEHFDYILMDVQMPGMDGFEATRRILEVSGARKPRIIAMTANALPGDRERCLAAGMTDYITKPVRPGALAAALKQQFEGKRTPSEPSGITDVLDAQVLEDLRMLEETSGTPLIADLVASFRSDVPAKLEELRAASLALDMERVRSLAHRLRGSAGAIGANRVFVTATEIEAKAETSAVQGLDPLIEQLGKDVKRAIDAFGRVLERMQRDGATGNRPSV